MVVAGFPEGQRALQVFALLGRRRELVPPCSENEWGALLVADAQRLLALVDVALEDFLRILIICVDEAYVPVAGRERSSTDRCTR